MFCKSLCVAMYVGGVWVCVGVCGVCVCVWVSVNKYKPILFLTFISIYSKQTKEV